MRGSASPIAACLAGLALVAALALVLLLLISFALVGSADAFDPAVLLRLRGWTGDHGPIIAAAKAVTAFGDDLTLAAVTLIAAGYFVSAERLADARRLFVTASVGGLLTVTIKLLVGRPRPTLVAHLVSVRPPSFPSGHATNSTVVHGTLALIAARRASTSSSRSYVAIVTIALVILIGLSRVLLGVHWPSDVLAGWSLGASWALLAARVAERVPAKA